MTYIEEVEKRANAATPGPWGIDIGKGSKWKRITYTGRNYDYPDETYTDFLGVKDQFTDSYEFWDKDADFIANARTDIPRLIAMVRDRNSALKKAEKAVKEMDCDCAGEDGYTTGYSSPSCYRCEFLDALSKIKEIGGEDDTTR